MIFFVVLLTNQPRKKPILKDSISLLRFMKDWHSLLAQISPMPWVKLS